MLPPDNSVSVTRLKVPITVVGIVFLQFAVAWAWIDNRIEIKIADNKAYERELLSAKLDAINSTLTRHEQKLDLLIGRASR